MTQTFSPTSVMANEPTMPNVARHWLDQLLLLTLLLSTAVVMSNAHAEPDIWGHVQYGRDALTHGLPATTTYSYTAEGYPWINHENLAELSLAFIYDRFGATALLCMKAVAGLLVMSLMIRQALRQGTGQLALYGSLLLVAANLTFFWMLRPQLLSYVLFALLLALLSWCFEGWEGKFCWRAGTLNYSSRRMRALWLGPVILFLWANTHGAFLAGLGIFCVYLMGRSIEAYSSMGRESFGLLKRFAMMITAACLATVLTPYGFHLHRWLLKSLIAPRPEIVEWLPPEVAWTMTSLAWLPFWIALALTIAALYASRRTLDLTQTVILAIVTWQSVAHRRHIALFAILFAFWMTGRVALLLRRIKIGVTDRSLAALPKGGRVAFGALLFASCGLVSFNLYEQLQTITVRRDSYPVAAFQFIGERQLNGKLVVAFNWAQYAIMAFGAEHADDTGLRVAFDGRYDTCYPLEIVDMQFDWEQGVPNGPRSRYRSPNSPPPDGQRLLAFHQPDLVLLARAHQHSVEMLAAQCQEWSLLYQDELAQLWGRTARYGDSASPDFIPVDERIITNERQTGLAAWPALPHVNRQRVVKQPAVLPRSSSQTTQQTSNVHSPFFVIGSDP